ncbi:MAG: 4Fe-4S dicluster domain-containing protein [Thermoanaerobaculia bacterium]
MAKIKIDKNTCKGCELCVKACPQQILEMSKELNVKGYFFATVKNQPLCIGCRLCCITCPDMAIEMSVQGTFYKYFEY